MEKKSQISPSKKGTWAQAVVALVWPILLIFGVRWLIVEPFQIPSGSMIPTLLVKDHILVQKFVYGVRGPWADSHWLFWGRPQRGDVVVFRYPVNPEVYYIKRLIGLPGDEITISGREIVINGQALHKEVYEPEVSSLEEKYVFEKSYTYFKESTDQETHLVQYLRNSIEEYPQQTFKVPEGAYFMMGDNRDESSDSRTWGFVEQKYIIGKAWVIWLSCKETLSSAPQLCDPSQMRWHRLFKRIQGLDL